MTSGDWRSNSRFRTGRAAGADPYDEQFDDARDQAFGYGSRDAGGRYDQSGDGGWPGEYGGSGEFDRFGPPDEYDRSGRYDGPGGYAEPGEYGDPGGYGASGGYGRPGPAQDPRDPYLEPGYWAGSDPRGQADYPSGAHRYVEPGSEPGYYGHTNGYGDSPAYDESPAYDDPGTVGDDGTIRYDSWDRGRGRHSSPEPFAEDYGAAGHPYARDPYRDGGALGRPDTGSFPRPDSGSFPRPDSGSFPRPDSGSFRRPETYGDDPAWPSDQAPGQDGYAQWRDEPDAGGGLNGRGADDAWDDDQQGDVLTRITRGGGGRGTGRGRARRPKRRRRRAAVVAGILAGALVLGVGAGFGYEKIHGWIIHRYGNYSGQGHGWVQLTVPQNATLESLGPKLLQLGVIEALRPFDSAASAAQNASSLQPGIYKLHYQMNSALVVSWLLGRKNLVANNFTLLPDARAKDIAANLAKATRIPVSQFIQIIEHPPASLGLPSWAAGQSAEGFLFPDTYTLPPHGTALSILQMMVADFNHRIASLNLPSAASKVFTTPYHVLIVASMVQAEAGSVSDFPNIARVAWNRLGINMKLQFDSTVFYAMGKFGTAITQAQESYPSPYNTYLHTGLPPGPIGSPSLAAIQGALHPTDTHAAHGWLYFITDLRGKGPHRTYFTGSKTQFDQWQQQFQG